MLWLLLSLILAIGLAYHRAGLRTSTAAFAALVLAYGVFGGSVLGFGLALLAFVGIFVPLSLPTLRQEWLTRPLLDRALQLRLPAASAALHESDWDHRLLGEATSEKISVRTPPDFTAVDTLFDRLLPLLEQPAPAQLQGLINERLLAPSLPMSEGGLELPAAVLSALIQRLAHQSPQSLLPELIAGFDASSRLLAEQSHSTQASTLLPRLADGSLRCALASSAYWASNDSLPDQAVVSRGLWKGKETTGLELRLDKLVDRSAALANEFIVLLQLRDPESLLGTGQTEGAVLVRVPVQVLELQAEARHWRLRTHSAFVPLDHLVGGITAVGSGHEQLGSAESAWAAMSIAAHSGRRARQLEQQELQLRLRRFHRLRTTSLPAALKQFGEQALDVCGLDSLRRLLANMLDQPPASARIAALALQLSEQLTGTTVSENRAEAALDSLLQSLNPAIPQTLAAAAAQPYGLALIQFDEALWPLLGEVAAHKSQALILALSDGRIADTRSGGRHAQRLARYRAALAFCADLQALYPSRATAPARAALVELACNTLALAAGLRVQEENSLPRDQQDLLAAHALRCACRAEAALGAFARSQTRGLLRIGLRLLLLPLGARQAQIADDPQRIGETLLRNPSSSRLRPPLPQDTQAAALEAALLAAEAAQKRLLQALDNHQLQAAGALDQIAQALSLNLITADEAELLRSALNLSEDWLRDHA